MRKTQIHPIQFILRKDNRNPMQSLESPKSIWLSNLPNAPLWYYSKARAFSSSPLGVFDVACCYCLQVAREKRMKEVQGLSDCSTQRCQDSGHPGRASELDLDGDRKISLAAQDGVDHRPQCKAVRRQFEHAKAASSTWRHCRVGSMCNGARAAETQIHM